MIRITNADGRYSSAPMAQMQCWLPYRGSGAEEIHFKSTVNFCNLQVNDYGNGKM